MKIQILKSIFAGDAIGSVFNGMSEGHIKANFSKEEMFPDPLKALKKNESLWRKPGLYTSVSQLSLVGAFLSSMRRVSASDYLSVVRPRSESLSLPWGVFRHPDRATSFFIESSMKDGLSVPAIPSVSLPSASAAASVFHPNGFSRSDLIRLFTSFTVDPFTVCACLIMAEVVHNQACRSAAVSLFDAVSLIKGDIEIYPVFFSRKINPESAEKSFDAFMRLFEKTAGKDMISAAKLSADAVSSVSGQNVTRATVENPLSALAIAASAADNCEFFCAGTIARMGGCSSQIASLGGVFSVLRGFDVPAQYFDNMVNKRNLLELFSCAESGRINTAVLNDFLAKEMPLSLKELEEFQKKQKTKEGSRGKTQSKHSTEDERLSRHVVESWTKTDKARYKKEKRKGPDHL